LKAREFAAALRRHPRLKPRAIEAARAVLVDGQTLEEAAQACGLTRQRVHAAAALLHGDAIPAGWVTAFVTLPPKLMKQVQALETKARREWRQCQK
jgi:hypothetical protein